MRSHIQEDPSLDEGMEKIEKMTRHRETMLLYLQDVRLQLLKKKNPLASKKTSKYNYTITLAPALNDDDSDFVEENPLSKEINSLQFLMTPRVVYLSLKNQQSIPYIAHLTLMPKSVTPFSENYIFEWKSVESSKTVGYINISWIKYVHSEGKNRFCVVCYDYEKKGRDDNENFKYAHFTVPNNEGFNDRQDGAIMAANYVESLNFISQKFKENTFLKYQCRYLNQ